MSTDLPYRFARDCVCENCGTINAITATEVIVEGDDKSYYCEKCGHQNYTWVGPPINFFTQIVGEGGKPIDPEVIIKFI